MNRDEWIVNGEVGISSKTMWAALVGVIPENSGKGFKFDVPHDPDDFRRCKLFVEQCGLTSQDLKIIKMRVSWFAPFIDNWAELNRLYAEESPNGECPKLYAFMKELEEQSMVLAGWHKTSPYSWTRDKGDL